MPDQCVEPYCLNDGSKNKHIWEFYYYLRKQGDQVTVKVRNGKVIVTLWSRSND